MTSAAPTPPAIPAAVPPVGVLLAAGAGRRAGGPKALRRAADGRPWVVAGVRTLAHGGCSPVIVTVGCRADQVSSALAEEDVDVVRVPDWSTGQAASVRAGLGAAADTGATAAVIHLVDLPDVTAAVVRRVVTGADATSLARAAYDGRPGHPVLIGADHVASVLASLTGDAGARDYLESAGVRLVECGDLAGGDDVDHD